jgi:hypothetical protein
MRLINTTTYELEEFLDSAIPLYAILSHRWENEEVVFNEFNRSSSKDRAKKGYRKIMKACKQAAIDDLGYIWVDTCCIDKSSSAELTESINSMFRWYQKANVCYAYLSDVAKRDDLEYSSWFKRGWTLQELIAPSNVEFYDQEWNFVGFKLDLARLISSITGIHDSILKGKQQPKDISVAARMSWAASRETSHVEDLAYCLLGIFDVNMPLIYGEGERSFRRLQEEIVKRSNDLTIFAWEYKNKSEERGPCDLFASTPACFALRASKLSGACVYRPRNSALVPAYSITNKGVLFDQSKHLFKIKTEDSRIRYIISLGVQKMDGVKTFFALQLRKVGPNVFVRHGRLLRMDSSERKRRVRIPRLSFYVLVDAQEINKTSLVKNPKVIHFSKSQRNHIREVIPESHWDETNQMFFTPSEDKALILAASCLILDGESSMQIRRIIMRMIVCINLRKVPPTCRILIPDEIPEHKEQSSWLFQHKRMGHDVTWDDAKTDLASKLGFKSPCVVSTEKGQLKISLSLRKRVVSSISEKEVYCLDFDCKPSADKSNNDSSQSNRYPSPPPATSHTKYPKGKTANKYRASKGNPEVKRMSRMGSQASINDRFEDMD